MSLTFSYQAQTADNQPLSGTLDAPDAASATSRLESLGLRVLELTPTAPPPRPKTLRGDDFLAFNRQLAQLTSAGMPVEHGLRLIAKDVRSGRLSSTLQQVADDLEKGQSLPQALERNRAKFPPLYARLVDAGVRTNNLPAMLLNLGRHLEMIQRLRALLWRAASYPLMVLLGLLAIAIFLGLFVLPKFELIFKDFGVQLPMITQFLIGIGHVMPVIAVAIAVTLAVIILLWSIFRATGTADRIRDSVLIHFPIVGGVIRWNLVARWCDALRLAVEAGLDLPAGIALANDAVSSPAVAKDAGAIRQSVESGQPAVSALTLRMHVLPATLPAAIGLASQQGHDLPATLANLSDMYQQQAELRMGNVPTVLAPAMLIGVALLVGFVILGMIAPLIGLIQAISGPHK